MWNFFQSIEFIESNPTDTIYIKHICYSITVVNKDNFRETRYCFSLIWIKQQQKTMNKLN